MHLICFLHKIDKECSQDCLFAAALQNAAIDSENNDIQFPFLVLQMHRGFVQLEKA